MKKTFRSATFLFNGEVEIKTLCEIDIASEGCGCKASTLGRTMDALREHVPYKQYLPHVPGNALEGVYIQFFHRLLEQGFCEVETPVDGDLNHRMLTVFTLM